MSENIHKIFNNNNINLNTIIILNDINIFFKQNNKVNQFINKYFYY